MEAIILQLLSNNNEEIMQATKQIFEIMRSVSAYQELWSVVVSSNNVNVRQSAALYFHSMVQKNKMWSQLSDEIRNEIKISILERIRQETEKKVKIVVIQTAGLIALTEPDKWPELFRLLEETVGCEGIPEMRELGMFVISILTEYATSLFELHVVSLLNLFGSVLTKQELSGTPLAYLAVVSMKNFLLFYRKKDKMIAQSFEYLIPYVLEVVKGQCTRNRIDRSVECIGFFDALLDSYPRIITLHLKNVIESLMGVEKFLKNDSVTCRILDVVSSIVSGKTKKVAKDEMVLQMLSQNLYEMISTSKPQKENVDHYDVFNGDISVVNSAVDVLDILATEIEPGLIMKHMMPILDNAANADNIFSKKAVYIILGVLVEKCSEQIRSSGVSRILFFIKEGLNSDYPLLINGALFTLWRFIEHFKPDINVYLIDFVSPLLQLLNNIEAKFKIIENHLIPRIFYMLSECCEILDSSLEPFLPFMVPILLSIITSDIKIHYRELAINVIGQTGLATKKGFREYFSVVLEVLRPFLVDNIPNDQLPLQVQTFDTLGTLFKNLYVKGDDIQLVEDVLNLTLTITEQKNIGELRSGLYSMFSDCSEFMKEKMENYIPRILKLMDITLREKYLLDGNISYPKFVGTTFDEFGDTTKNGAVCRDLKIIEEKEEALMALGNIAFNTGTLLQPYLRECYLISSTMPQYDSNVIRAAAVEALTNLYICIRRCYSDDFCTGIPIEELQLIEKFANIVQVEDNVDVVFAVLESFQKILNHVPQIVDMQIMCNPIGGRNITTNGTLIAGVVKLIITGKSLCQESRIREDESDIEEEDSEEEKRYDFSTDEEIEDNYSVEDLIIAAEELIPLLAEALPREIFLNFFCSNQRHILKLLGKHQQSQVRESTSATLGLCMKYLGDHMNVFAVEFAPIIPTLMKDTNDTIRNNVAFCIAQMILYAKEAMYSYFGDISTSLLNWLQAERCAMVIDNICGAIASLIVTHKDLISLNNIVPIFFHYLPLREDFDENVIVFKAFNTLFETENFKEYLTKAVEIVLTASINKQLVCEGAQQEALKLFELIRKCYSSEKELILRNLPEELKSHFVASL